ncbi:cell division cycle-associated protein 4 isoform X1 [Canis lupus familiaris]|nr:cell division cycle-associated protein 4 isoform X1 [Canis lupus familiaris]
MQDAKSRFSISREGTVSRKGARKCPPASGPGFQAQTLYFTPGPGAAAAADAPRGPQALLQPPCLPVFWDDIFRRPPERVTEAFTLFCLKDLSQERACGWLKVVGMRQGTMFARGLKRKSAEDGEDVEGGLAGTQATPSYSLQRQSLLDMSLVKLQLCHMLVEPNLCRSVLIANTVRQIQEEMTQDGTWRVLAPQAAGRAPLDRLVSTEILCRSVREQEGERPAADVGDGRTPGLVPGLSAVPSAQALRSPQSSLWEVDSSRENRGGFQKSLDQIFETLESKTPGSVEELFSDVDSSYYDLDAVLTGMVGSTQSGHGSGLQAFTAAATPPPGSSCRSDLGELDHAVEILVET